MRVKEAVDALANAKTGDYVMVGIDCGDKWHATFFVETSQGAQSEPLSLKDIGFNPKYDGLHQIERFGRALTRFMRSAAVRKYLPKDHVLVLIRADSDVVAYDENARPTRVNAYSVFAVLCPGHMMAVREDIAYRPPEGGAGGDNAA